MNDQKSAAHKSPPTEPYTMQPIGVVHSEIKEPLDDCWGGLVSLIELDAARFTPECTRGLEEYSHVEIVFLLSKIRPESVLFGSKHPRERADWPRVGIFAMRAKTRPNRIGITVCKLERVDGLRLWVRELDAIDGTPVLDIKPYIQEFGPREAVRQPAWATELMSVYFRRK